MNLKDLMKNHGEKQKYELKIEIIETLKQVRFI